MSVVIGFVNEMQTSRRESTTKDSTERLTLESYLNIGNSTKREKPIDIHSLLKNEEQEAKVRVKSFALEMLRAGPDKV